MKIAADTGPLIGLAKIDCLSILKTMFTEVHIPPMVYRELLGKVSVESGLILEALDDFIQVTEPEPVEPEIKDRLVELDEGERQVIFLALTFSKDVLILMDDRAGRSAVGELGIPFTGLVGFLLLAKEKGLLL